MHVHAEPGQPVGDVARRRAIEIGQHQHAIAAVEIARARGRVAQRLIRVRVRRDFLDFDRQRQTAEHMARRRDERGAHRFVSEEEDADAHSCSRD